MRQLRDRQDAAQGHAIAFKCELLKIPLAFVGRQACDVLECRQGRLGQGKTLLETGKVRCQRANCLVADGKPVRQIVRPVNQPDDRIIRKIGGSSLGAQRCGGMGDLVASDEKITLGAVQIGQLTTQL